MTQTMIMRRSGQAPLRVRGELIVGEASSMNNARSDYSGQPGRAQEISVVRTASGKYAVGVNYVTCWQGEQNSHEAAVFPSLPQVIEYLQNRIPAWMLQNLMEAVGEDVVAEDVE